MNLFDLFATITVDTDAYESGLEAASQKTQEFGNTTETQTSKFSTAWSSVSVAVGNLISDAVSGLVNTISSNIDSAIARVDTLNSYTTVMTGLGYSAEEAEAAITALTEGIQGLPTTLPNIVSQQQQFAALSGDIEEATELTIALNNATLAGGQGQEVANSALNQWYQIIANGTPDATAWQTINQAMPAQLKQIAQELMGTEATSQDLFNAWQDGTIATEEVTAAIIKLNEEGLEGYDSFATQAQSASSGIATSMENVQTAITNQLATIIDEMNGEDGQISGFFDEIKESIKGIDTTSLSESLGNLMETITSVLSEVDLSAVFTGIADAISLVVEAIGFLITNFDTILPIVTSVTAAMVAYQAASAISGVIDTLTTAISGSSSAFGALNSVMNANPFVLVATLIATVVTALVTLWNTNEGFREAVTSAWEAIKEVFSNAWEAIKSVWDAVQPYFQAIWDAIKSIFSVVADVLGGFFSAAWSVIKGVWDAVSPYFQAIWEVIQTVFSVVEDVLGGFFSAAWSVIQGVWDVVTGYFQNIWNTIKGIFSVVEAVLSGDFSGAWEAIKNVFSGWKDFFSGLWDKLTDVFSNVWEWFTDIGSNIVNGIKNGISNAWSSLKSWVSDKFSSLVSGVRSQLEISSPSKVFAEIGGYMAEGLGVGWEDEYSGIQKQIENGLDFGTANVDFASSGLGRSSTGLNSALQGVAASIGQEFTITVQSVLDGKVIGESAYQYSRNKQRAYGM